MQGFFLSSLLWLVGSVGFGAPNIAANSARRADLERARSNAAAPQTRSAPNLAAPGLAAEPVYFYKGAQKVSMHLDLTGLVVETSSSAFQVSQRLAARGLAAGVKPTTGHGTQMVSVRAKSRGDLSAQAQQIQAVFPGAEVRAILRSTDTTSATELLVTSRLTFHLQPRQSVDGIAARYQLKNVTPLPYSPGGYSATVEPAAGLLQSLMTANDMQESGDAEWATPDLKRTLLPRALPNDPMFNSQWYLRNTGVNTTYGTAGNDLNVVPAWADSTGNGVNIAINDEGVETTHSDLAANIRLPLCYDFIDHDTDNTPPPSFGHGTACAGLAAARGNNALGISGVAPDAGIAGLRIIGKPIFYTDEANSLAWGAGEPTSAAQIMISSNSWGPDDDGFTLDAPPPVTENAIKYGLESGRNGRGIVYMWAAGNGRAVFDNTNRDGYASNPNVIAVGATNSAGQVASYSEPGAPMLVNAPGGDYASTNNDRMLTTDISGPGGYNNPGDYTPIFLGTSAAAPAAAGVVALLLAVNPNLTYRDVMHILVDSAVKNDPANAGWANNGSGRHFSHDYGFGRINAAAAVSLARTWQNVPALAADVVTSDVISAPITIPDNSTAGVLVSIPVTAPADFVVEHVELEADITHPFRGDIVILLQSPTGMISVLMEDSNDSNADFSSWKFRSVAHWGENPTGTWQVLVADLWANKVGTINHMKLRIMGYEEPNASVADWRLFE